MSDSGGGGGGPADGRAYSRRLARTLTLYVIGLLGFIAALAWAEQLGLSRHWIGPIFLFLTVMVYVSVLWYQLKAVAKKLV